MSESPARHGMPSGDASVTAECGAHRPVARRVTADGISRLRSCPRFRQPARGGRGRCTPARCVTNATLVFSTARRATRSAFVKGLAAAALTVKSR